MDFVIFGVGLGATFVLFGWLWRTLGPRFRFRAKSDAVLSGEDLVAGISWSRFCRSGGAVWVLGGCLLVLAAFVSLLLHLSDRTGALVVVSVFLAICLGVILWLWAYLHRFGLTGLVPRREPKPVVATTQAPASTPRRPAARQKQPAIEGPAVPSSLPIAARQGPPIPDEGATPPVTGSVAASSPGRQPAEEETGATVEATAEVTPPTEEGAEAAGTASDVPAVPQASEARPRPAPTVFGESDREEVAGPSIPVTNAETPPGRNGGGLVNASGRERSADESDGSDRAAVSPQSASPSPSSEQQQAPQVEIARSNAGASVSAGAEQNAPAATAAHVPQQAGEQAHVPSATKRPFGPDAFRASIARQEAHLAQAASRGENVGQRGQDQSPEKTRRFPAPRGREGGQWVRSDGSGTVPPGFAIKGDPATRLYYAESSPLYERATARFFFASVKDAEAAGYRPAPAPRRATEPRAQTRRQANDGAGEPHPPAPVQPVPDGTEGTDWVRGDGTNAVPPGFPIKGNANAKLYYPVGTRLYDQTVAEYYFASPQTAEAAGYRPPQAVQQSAANTRLGSPGRTSIDASANELDHR